ncbi:MAG: hypothetical protein ACREPR_12860, partial [Brasilonema sp.]
MDILKTVNKISQILSEKNINYIYLCGGTGRKFLAVGIDALDNSLTLGESITDIDILAETDKENIDADTL